MQGLIFNPSCQRYRFLPLRQSEGPDFQSPGAQRYVHGLGRLPGPVTETKFHGVKHNVLYGAAQGQATSQRAFELGGRAQLSRKRHLTNGTLIGGLKLCSFNRQFTDCQVLQLKLCGGPWNRSELARLVIEIK